jgi:hypothetical protein
MAALWWKWGRRTITATSAAHNIDQVYSGIVTSLSKNKDYMGVTYQNSGDVTGMKNGLRFAVAYRQISGSSTYWQIIAVGGGTKGQADFIFNDLVTIVNKLLPP